MLTVPTLEMLAFIRYLYNLAMEQSRQPEPTGTVSILTFHDSIELFLDLACDQFGVPSKKTKEFKDYWSVLETHLQGQSLSQKRSMERLNAARVNFKHHSIRSSSSDIEKFRINVADFFQDNTPLIFGIAFDEISMTYLIQNTRVKTLLDEASTLIEQGERGDALDKIALAFAWVIGDARENKFGWQNAKHFFFGRSFGHLTGMETKDLNPKLLRYVEGIASSVENLYEAMSMFSLGLDYQRYIKFKLLTPYVYRTMGSEDYQIARPSHPSPQIETPSIERCRFCYDFVVDCANRLQSFDFELGM